MIHHLCATSALLALSLASPAYAEVQLPSIDDAPPTGERAPQDVALVIGNEDYAVVTDVPYAHRDARAFYGLLHRNRGVPEAHMRLLEEANRVQILEAVRELALVSSDDGVFWIYFSGHGGLGHGLGQ